MARRKKTPGAVGTLVASEGGDSASFVGMVGVTGTLAAQEGSDAASFAVRHVAGFALRNLTHEEFANIDRHRDELKALGKTSPTEARARMALRGKCGDRFPAEFIVTTTKLHGIVNDWLAAHGVEEPVSRESVKRASGRRDD
jgi:hypothetical protein